MCGIAGFLSHDRRPADVALLRRMADAIAHRGPDGSGVWTADGVGLAHRRLSIIDLEGGQQPLGNEDNTIQVVFNGEIYNFRELRDDLERRGHAFRTHSDTEVLVHLYEELGGEMVTRLRGMFAFAIWDSRRRILLLARDRVGIKPLYVFRNHEWLLFGSELKALLAHPAVPREVSPTAIDDYFTFGMIPGDATIFRGVEKLPPAHVLTVHADSWSMRTRRYWQLDFTPDESLTLPQWNEAVASKLRETVKAHLVADVPVGAFLSGGLDSSIIVAEATAQNPTLLRTFSIGFRESRFNELPHARAVAEHFGTEHIDEIVTADAAALLPELTQFYDEPFADSSAIPTFLVSKLASQHVKVVLSGDGGDEALGGYSRYAHDLKETAWRRFLPCWLRRSLLAGVARAWPKLDGLPRPLRLKSALTNLSLDDAAAYANTLTLCRQPRRSRLLNDDVRSALDGHDSQRIAREAFAQGATDPLAGMIAADMATLLPDDYLVKVDRASMAHGLEVRPPLLDHEFLELCARLPSRWKIHNGETKWLLRELSRDVLPKSIRQRPKQGFEIPLDDWFRGPLVPLFADAVLSPNARVAEFVSQRTARGLFEAHCRGTARHGTELWMLLSLASWTNQYLTTPQPQRTCTSQPWIANEASAPGIQASSKS